jgi:hypothetical protein
MTTLRSSTASDSAGARSVIRLPLKAVAVAALLLGTTAMFEPTPVQAGFGGMLSHAMRMYGAHYGGGHRSRGSSRHSRRDRDRDSSRHASRHHREGRSRETRSEPEPAEPPAQESKAAAKTSDGPNFTPAR